MAGAHLPSPGGALCPLCSEGTLAQQKSCPPAAGLVRLPPCRWPTVGRTAMGTQTGRPSAPAVSRAGPGGQPSPGRQGQPHPRGIPRKPEARASQHHRVRRAGLEGRPLQNSQGGLAGQHEERWSHRRPVCRKQNKVRKKQKLDDWPEGLSRSEKRSQRGHGGEGTRGGALERPGPEAEVARRAPGCWHGGPHPGKGQEGGVAERGLTSQPSGASPTGPQGSRPREPERQGRVRAPSSAGGGGEAGLGGG